MTWTQRVVNCIYTLTLAVPKLNETCSINLGLSGQAPSLRTSARVPFSTLALHAPHSRAGRLGACVHSDIRTMLLSCLCRARGLGPCLYLRVGAEGEG